MKHSQLPLTTALTPHVFETVGTTYNLAQAHTLARIYDIQEERGEGQEISVINEWFPLRDLAEMAILGSFAWSLQSGQHKWILGKNARLDKTWGTPADRARDYLRANGHHKAKRRLTSQQYEQVVLRRRSHPLYAQPCVIGDAVYVDIQAAYFSIVKSVGWDVDYNPGRWLGVSSTLEDFPFPQDKLARNSLVSLSLPGQIKVWTGEKLGFAQRRNPFINVALWSFVHDVLHGVAADMVAAGAVYVFTDGYILPASHEQSAFDVLAAWGLPGSARHRGRAVIRGTGDYDIDGHKSRLTRSREMPFNNLHPVEPDWLRKKVRRWSERYGG